MARRLIGQYEYGDLPSKEEERRMLLAHQKDPTEQTSEWIVRSYVRMVYKIAATYSHLTSSLDTEDLVQIGILSLLSLATRFDPRKARFSTYATVIIKRDMQEAVDRSKFIETPEKVSADKRVLDRTMNSLDQDGAINPSIKELSLATGFSEDRVLDLLKLPTCSTSLDEAFSSSPEDSDVKIGDIIPDDRPRVDEYVSERIDAQEFVQQVTRLLARYPSEWREVYLARFGLQDYRPHTIVEISEKTEQPVSTVAQRIKRMNKYLLQQLLFPNADLGPS